MWTVVNLLKESNQIHKTSLKKIGTFYNRPNLVNSKLSVNQKKKKFQLVYWAITQSACSVYIWNTQLVQPQKSKVKQCVYKEIIFLSALYKILILKCNMIESNIFQHKGNYFFFFYLKSAVHTVINSRYLQFNSPFFLFFI